MPSRKVEQQLDSLSDLRTESPETALPALRKALSASVNVVVAKAAKISAERNFSDVIPDLLRAYDRLFEEPVKRDPQCWGKRALAAALKDLDYSESAPFLRGLHHVQMEPVYGGEVDTAEGLRGVCLLALVACTDLDRGEAMRCFVDGLCEKSGPIRVEAARALGQMEGDDAALVLRLKARLGDDSPEVLGQIFDSVLRIEGEQAVPFLASFFHQRGDAREEAALALGSSRLAGVLEILREAWKSTRDAGFQEVLLRAASSSRLESSLGWLLEIARTGRLRDALSAIRALALHRGSEEIRRDTEAAVRERESELREEYSRLFGPQAQH
jgi:hypothetical protein